MTQHELAATADVPQSSIARIEKGRVSPRADTLLTLIRATGHDLSLAQAGVAPQEGDSGDWLRLQPARRTHDALGDRVASDIRTSPIRMLRVLRRFNVPFVLIGDLAEVAHGARGTLGRMIEICIAQTDVAASRLATALDELGASRTSGSPVVETAVGRLRLWSRTAAGDDYDLLDRNATQVQIDVGLLVAVASLEDLIRHRRSRGGAGDLVSIGILQSIADDSIR
ncbi:MAG: helix-turn-helix transcriptional regulator [Chloroflexi bacterium]|nr:helix-turn-helix transcriptional regulator [Chloroflexota bacterium]